MPIKSVGRISLLPNHEDTGTEDALFDSLEDINKHDL